MKYLSTTTFFILCFFVYVNSQSVELSLVSSAGGFFQTDNESLTFTVGEIVTETFSSSDLILTQGFLQVYDEETDYFQKESIDLEIMIYPNPVSTFFNLKINNCNTISNANPLLLNIFDINGKNVLSKKVIQMPSQIDISSLYSGTYFVKLQQSSSNINQSTVIQKISK